MSKAWNNVKQAVKPVKKKPNARLLTVKSAWYLTPSMIRVTFAGTELDGFPVGREGGNCKLMIPDLGESREDFAARLMQGPAPIRRTYTVRHYRQSEQELDIDFVAHGDQGPASAWAMRAKPGSFLGFAGPSTAKVTHFEADWYLIAADSSALPMAAATLEAMPRDAKGIAVFEVPTKEDIQQIDSPNGIDIHWLFHPDSHQASQKQEAYIRALEWPSGRVQVCIAGESSVVKGLRAFIHDKKAVAKQDLYLSGYWKIGLVEDEHQQMKRRET